jgi:hypothetical protein
VLDKTLVVRATLEVQNLDPHASSAVLAASTSPPACVSASDPTHQNEAGDDRTRWGVGTTWTYSAYLPSRRGRTA